MNSGLALAFFPGWAFHGIMIVVTMFCSVLATYFCLRRQLRQLRDSRQLQTVALDYVQSGIIACDSHGTLRILNRAIKDLYHLPENLDSVEELERYVELYEPRTKPDENPLFFVLHGGQVRRMEVKTILNTGEERTVLVNGQPITSVNGGPTGAVVVVHDISARKREQQELEQVAANLAEAQRMAHLGNWEWRVQADEVIWSDEAYRIFGLEPQQVKLNAGSFFSAVHPEDVEIVQQTMNEAVTIGAQREFEVRIRRPNSQERVITAKIEAQLNEEGAPTRFFGTVLDITDRKQIEQALQKAVTEAEDLNRAKSEFLANMSHEIRTPMNGVIGMTTLALSTALNDEQREYIATVQESAYSLLAVINDILDYSKIEAGKLDLDLVPASVSDLAKRTLKALAVRAHEKELELLLQVAPSVPEYVFCDPLRIRQVLTNLVGNAIKFTEKGEIDLTIEGSRYSTEEVEITFTIRDTGIGISPEQSARIFEAFHQADHSTSRRFGGTGLGLSISSSLVELMGGSMSLESEPGKGSTFHFTLRLKCAPTPPDAPLLQDRRRLAGLPVLIVDDNATNLRILDALLTKWEMCPTLASSPMTALNLVREAVRAQMPFPLVLLDANMPELSGFELAERIGESSSLSPAAIVMLSSLDSSGRQRCRELGIAAHLVKPVGEEELLEAILVALGAPILVLPPKERATFGRAQQSLKILLVEDNLVNRRLGQRLLEKRGHQATLACDGLQAVEACLGNAFDVVLMDVQLPGLNGLEATALIRQNKSSKNHGVPIIGLTASAMRGDREVCLNAGMDDYLTKPIDSEQLFRTVEGFGSRFREIPLA